MEIRDAVPEDASAACHVLRRSISELCVLDHQNDQTVLQQWLSNKTPDIIAASIVQRGHSALVAVEGGAPVVAFNTSFGYPMWKPLGAQKP